MALEIFLPSFLSLLFFTIKKSLSPLNAKSVRTASVGLSIKANDSQPGDEKVYRPLPK